MERSAVRFSVKAGPSRRREPRAADCPIGEEMLESVFQYCQ